MKRLLPLRLLPDQLFDPVSEFSDDIARLVAAAKAGGYLVTPAHAGELWRRHCEAICASWFEVTGDESTIVAALLEQAEVTTEITPTVPPPSGYGTWLDYAVATLDTRSVEIEQMLSENGEPVSRQAMQDAARDELAVLRKLSAQ